MTERFDLEQGGGYDAGGAMMVENPLGDYVRFESYEALREVNAKLVEAAEDLLRNAYSSGRGGIVEFRPHEFDDLKDAVQAAIAKAEQP